MAFDRTDPIFGYPSAIDRKYHKSIFGKTEAPPVPVVRMPVMNQPAVTNATERARRDAMRRTGRQSTIMTDMTRGVTGSAGKLGV